MKIISVFDTRIAGSNLGDHIIMQAVEHHLREMLTQDFFIRIQTHDNISQQSYALIKQSNLKFCGGTNLLSSNMDRYNQWKVNLWDSIYINDVVLMGVGWWQYQKAPNNYTKILLGRLLSSKYIHSVRDSYTEKQMKLCGFDNVLNTSCPTMWRLTPQHCASIPASKSDEVVMTLTEYNMNQEYDTKLYNILKKHYQKIYFWIQQPGDYVHMQNIASDMVEYIPPTLEHLDALLSDKQVDYIGTRLHAGIRALQHKRRTLILGVDNRASEIARDTNLPVVNRANYQDIEDWIVTPKATQITLPEENIKSWRQQFSKKM
ncbi:polysaccharide pyruvyl transferase family protein [Pelosinus baikalensis]|uniref:Polysaccharide pyruvyl transferase family protein n=1 Tax=Pelosinus baikalensis TaxID=2892015 RepID=A0ABS8HPP7_9FIRM|nr:polysaccharide pyruvyl transferase family protein [Pelosinus baikalensis]MCC5464087.1 polysaccharide pyruvyl transferase family protein [Pelosinus baikalensis]